MTEQVPKKRRGRPVVAGTDAEHVLITINVLRTTRDQIRAIAEEKGVGLSALMRTVIQRGLEGL